MLKSYITNRDIGLRKSLKELGIKLSSNEHLSYFIKTNARLFFRIFIFLAVWFLVYAFLTYEATYQSSAKLIIRNSAITENYLVANRQNYLLTTTTGLRDPVLNTMHVIDSALIVERLWEYFQEKHPEELERLKIKNKEEWMKFNGSSSKGWCRFLNAKNISSTDVITASFTWTDPIIAKEALEVAVKAFQDKNLELNKLESKRRSRYLDKQVLEIEQQAEQIRRVKSRFKQKINIADLGEKSRKMTNLREEIANKLSDTLSRVKGREAEVKRYQSLIGLTPSEAVDATALGQNKTYEKLRDEIYKEYGNLGLLKATYTNKSPKVKESQQRLSALEQQLKEEAKKSISYRKKSNFKTHIADFARGQLVETMSKSYADAIFLKEKARILKDYLGKLEQEIMDMPEYERRLDEIKEKEKSLDKSLDILRRQQIEAHLKENETLSSLFIIDNPDLPAKALFPSMKHQIAIALILSIVVAFFILVVFNLIRFSGFHLVKFLDNKIKRLEGDRIKYSGDSNELRTELKDPTGTKTQTKKKNLDGLVNELDQSKEVKGFLEKYGSSKLIEFLRHSIGDNKTSIIDSADSSNRDK